MKPSNGTSTQGEQLFKSILKPIHKYKSYGSDKSGPMSGRTDGRTHELTHPHTPKCSCDDYVLLTAIHMFFYFTQTYCIQGSKLGYSCLTFYQLTKF